MTKKEKDKIQWNFKDVMSYFISKKFFTNLGFIILLLIILLFLLAQGLKIFTHHGDKIHMPDYVNTPLTTAEKDASDRTFKIVVNDSIFIVGKPGNIILNQNPKPNTYVKENRTIYVTVTKSLPETFLVKDLPRLYGENFDIKSQELMLGYNLESIIAGQAYDPGPEGHILAVLSKGDTIVSSRMRKNDEVLEKGQTLHFILSKRTGGNVNIPQLRCRTYSEARFLLASYNLEIKAINDVLEGQEQAEAYISYQDPSFDPEKKVTMGDTIFVYLTTDFPDNCGENNVE